MTSVAATASRRGRGRDKRDKRARIGCFFSKRHTTLAEQAFFARPRLVQAGEAWRRWRWRRSVEAVEVMEAVVEVAEAVAVVAAESMAAVTEA